MNPGMAPQPGISRAQICKSQFARLLPPESELYRRVGLDSHSELFFYFIPKEKKWDLLVIQAVYSTEALDISEVRKAVQKHLREWFPPAVINLLQFRGLEEEGSQGTMMVTQELREAEIPYLCVSHSFSKEEVQDALGFPIDSRRFPLREQTARALIIILIVSYGIQLGLEYFLPSQRWVFVLGVNRFNFFEGKYLALLGGTFLHGGVAHLLLNLLALHYLGGLCSRFYHPMILLMIYFLSACTGAMASVLFLESTSVGASGAIFGLAGAAIIGILAHRKVMNSFLCFHLSKTLKGLWALLLLNAFLPIFVPKIDVWGHLGGFLGGFLLASCFSYRKELIKFFISLISFAALSIGLFLGARESSISFVEEFRKREREQIEVLEWMNTRLLPLQKEIESMLLYPIPHDSDFFQKYFFRLNFRIKELRNRSDISGVIGEYLQVLEEGITLVGSGKNSEKDRSDWIKKVENIQKKIMDSYGLMRKS